MKKKSIRSIAVLAILSVFGISLTSCEKEYVSELQSLVFQNMSFGVNTDMQQITFANHDLSNYSITSSESWCTGRIDVPNSTLIVYVTKNDTYDSRTATLTINDFKDGVSTKSFTVSQDGMKGLIVDEDTYEVSMDGGQVEVKVRRNVDFDVTIPSSDTWIKVVSKSRTRGLETATVTFNIEKNRTGASRASVINISNKSEGLSQNIAITQGFTPIFSVDTNSFTCDELANEFTVSVTANFVVDVFALDEWIMPQNRVEIDDDHFTQEFKIRPFSEKQASRSATIYIENTVVGKSASIKVTQYRTFYLSIYDKTIEVGDRFPIDGSGYLINTNDRPTVWMSTDTTVVKVSQQGVAVGVGQGTANVVVSSEDGKYTDYMMITVQKPYDIQDYIFAQWERDYRADTVYAVNSIFINNSSNTVYLKSWKLYNDSVMIAGSDGNMNRRVPSYGEYSLSSSRQVQSSKTYWIDWTYTFNDRDYTLRLDKSGKLYDPTVVVPVDTTTTTPAAARSRMAAIRKRR